jgi:hypothetical protein
MERRAGWMVLAASAVLLGSATPLAAQGANNRCQTSSFYFGFEGESIAVRQVVPSGGCTTGFRGGVDVAFEEITFVQRPASLAFEPRSNGFAWRLRPRSGFRGQDSYTVRVCGTYRGRRGCTTLAYSVTVD